MAVFGNIGDVKEYYRDTKQLHVVFEYLQNAVSSGSEINKRILALESDQYEKVILTEDIFAIEQSYVTRTPQESFFEAHQKFVDFQCIVKEKESMYVLHIDKLTQTAEYNQEDDYAKYGVDVESSQLIVDAGDVAIFFPKDGHMPAMQVQGIPQRIYKTVVKVPYRYFFNN